MKNSFSKVKVLMLLPSLRAGGAEKVAVTYLRHFDHSLFDITLLVIGNNKGELFDLLPQQVKLKALNRSRVSSALFEILVFVWKERPKLIFSNLSYLNLMMAAIRPLLPKSSKLIVRESNIASININRSKNRFLHWFLYRFCFRKLDKIICQTKYMSRDLICNFGVSQSNIIVLPNPIDVKWVEELSLEFSVKKPANITLVACGRLTWQKGFDILLDAIFQLRRNDIEIWILGDGSLKSELETKKRSLGLKNVKFLGFKKNPFPYIKCADAFILSSRYEGMPNVLLESLALKTPIIAVPTKGGGIEFFENKNCGVIADSINATSLSVLISKFLSGDLDIKVNNSDLDGHVAAAVVENLQNEMLKISQ